MKSVESPGLGTGDHFPFVQLTGPLGLSEMIKDCVIYRVGFIN